MKVRSLGIAGAHLLVGEPAVDERGSFTKLFDGATFPGLGLTTRWNQECSSFNKQAGTVRGLHFQAAPHEETKLVRCVLGRIFDVMVDLRPGSATYRQWEAVELDAAEPVSLYIPAGLAHGYMTLVDDTAVHYLISATYHPQLQRGIRWNDPTIGIRWPRVEVACLSPRDADLPFFNEE